MSVEDQITAIRPLILKNPFGWLICYENRPLQGIPPKGDGPHLLFFSEETKAQAFIAGRKKYFGEEPLSSVNVDSPDTLKSLALSPSGDVRYAAPPCGIVLDFDYATKEYRKVLAPAEVNSLLPVEIARAFGFTVGEAAEIKRESSRPARATEPQPQPGQKRPGRAGWITCGALLLLGLLVICVGGVWYGMRRGMIPALPFFSTPTATNMPTATFTPTPTPLPTATATPTATTLAWEINVEDDFASNAHGWPLGLDKGQYGTSNIAIQNGKLVWELESVDNCWYWWHPDLTSVADFDASIEVKRTGGSTSGDYGMVVRADSAKNSFYYFGISDSNQKFAFFIYQNEKWTKILDWTFNASIGPGNVNRIEVVAKGSQFVFLINGVFAGEAQDAKLTSGKIGILAELYDHADNIKIEYDKLVLHGNR